jgi:hypothetical protein
MARDLSRSWEGLLWWGDHITPLVGESHGPAAEHAELMQQLVVKSEGKLVTSKTLDKFQDPGTFERTTGTTGRVFTSGSDWSTRNYQGWRHDG